MSEQEQKFTQFVTFKLADELFAVDVSKAKEILDHAPVTKVPQTPEFILGVINLRGSVVPVIDLRCKFGMGRVEQTVESCIIVMEVNGEDGLTDVSVLADAVCEVLELDDGQIEPPPRLGTRLRTEFIRGLGKVDDEFVILLDIDRVFSVDELSLVQEVEQAEVALENEPLVEA